MTDDVLDRIAYVTALDVPADAVLAVKANRPITKEQAQAIQEQLEAVLPGRKVLVLSENLDLVVVRDEQ